MPSRVELAKHPDRFPHQFYLPTGASAMLWHRAGYRMDLPGPTTSVGTRIDYSVGPWDYPTCAARYLMA
jgi:hypothetical protein